MPKLYSVRFDIGETLDQFTVALAAWKRFQAGIRIAQPGFLLPEGTQPHHLDLAVEKLEGTYLIKMWAVFEGAWVSFWRHRTGNTGMIKAMHLIRWAEGVQRAIMLATTSRMTSTVSASTETSWSTATTRASRGDQGCQDVP